MSSIANNIQDIQAKIAKACARADRPDKNCQLIAVSKVQPQEKLQAALEAGHRLFGENRVQEAQEHWQSLRSTHPDLRLHLIGPLQTNKAREAVRLFDAIQTVDRPKLAEILAKELARETAETGRTLECYVQVNTGEEPQKAGILPKDAEAFIDDCRNRLALPITGVMCIPPVEDEPSPHFAFLRELAKRAGLRNISMGMSADYELAAELGATHVRVGTAVFGARDYG